MAAAMEQRCGTEQQRAAHRVDELLTEIRITRSATGPGSAAAAFSAPPRESLAAR